MYIRDRQIKLIFKTHGNESNASLIKWENASMVFGVIGCLGLTIVANFQETNALVPHLTGAMMAFGIGIGYFILQVSI